MNDIKKYIYDRINSNENIYGIFYNKTHIGNIKLGPIDNINKVAKISYFIGDKEYWNLNISTKAINIIINIAKIKKIVAGVIEPNKASQKVLMKNGFELEGKLKKHYIYKNKRVNNLIFGKIYLKNFFQCINQAN